MTTVKLKTILKEVVRGVSSRVPKEDSADLVRIINIRDLIDGAIDSDSLEKRVVPAAQRKDERKVQEGDVVVAIRGSRFRAAIVDKQAEGHFISANLVVLRVENSKIYPKILTAYLNGLEGQHQLKKKAKGMTIPSISMKDFLSISIPLPPMETQKRMAEYLEYTAAYISMLRREEELVGTIRDNLMIRYFGVTA